MDEADMRAGWRDLGHIRQKKASRDSYAETLALVANTEINAKAAASCRLRGGGHHHERSDVRHKQLLCRRSHRSVILSLQYQYLSLKKHWNAHDVAQKIQLFSSVTST